MAAKRAKRRKDRGGPRDNPGRAEQDLEWVRRRAALLDPDHPDYDGEWRTVYAYSDLLRAKIRLRVREPADVDAVMGRVWENAFEHIGQVKSGSSLRGWLFSVADSAVASHFRTPKRRATREETAGDLPDVPGPGWNVLDRMVGAERLARLLERLNSYQRLVLIRYFTHGPRVRDVADELGTSVDAVNQALYRIRQSARGLQRGGDA